MTGRMNATTSPRMVRIKKEARALFWTWFAVVMAGALPSVVPHIYAEPFSFVSFFIGVPLLACLSLGNEFREHTLSLWLTQACTRTQLWGEKLMVMIPAVLSAGLVSGMLMFQVTWPHMRFPYKVAAIVYVFVSMASAPFWTLMARSTTGGVLMISFMVFVGSLFSGGIDDGPRPGGEWAFPETAAAISVLSIGSLCFTALMLWLGARKLARFQVTGGSADDDLLVIGPALLPDALSGLFRCRPSGAFFNLIRKEFRLLRPLWAIELIVVLYVACLAVFRLLPAPPVAEPRTVAESALVGLLMSVCLGMAGLAGILSLGEERTSGTHAWHMTLPVSASRQWLIKLVIALLAGVSCAVLLPVLVMMGGGALYGSPLRYVDAGALPDILTVFAILTFTCFWCGCAANGTVRAAMLAMPVTVAIPFASEAGMWLGEKLARSTGTLKDFVVSCFHLSPMTFATAIRFAHTHFLWLFVPTLLFALVHSYLLFRVQPDDSSWRMLRRVLLLSAVTTMWSFSTYAGFLSSRWKPFEETRQALNKFQPSTAKFKLTGEDLAKSSALSAPTRRWLKGSSITVGPAPSPLSAYLATIHLPSGVECKLTVTRFETAASCGRL